MAMQKKGDFPPEVVAALVKFMEEYKPVDSEREAKYFLSTTAVMSYVRSEAGSQDFDVEDAYNFMLKAGYRMQREETNKALITWFFAKR